MADKDDDLLLAAAWLANERLYLGRDRDDHSVPDGYALEVEASVRELMQTDIDPLHGARLVATLLDLAENDWDLRSIGAGPLETLLRNHGDRFAEWANQLADANPRFRAALAASWPQKATGGIHDRLDLHKGRTYSYWTVGFELDCAQAPSSGALLDSRLIPGTTGGDFKLSDKLYIASIDYWAQDAFDAEAVGQRIVKAVVARLAPYGCKARAISAPTPTWPPGQRPGIDPPKRDL